MFCLPVGEYPGQEFHTVPAARIRKRPLQLRTRLIDDLGEASQFQLTLAGDQLIEQLRLFPFSPDPDRIGGLFYAFELFCDRLISAVDKTSKAVLRERIFQQSLKLLRLMVNRPAPVRYGKSVGESTVGVRPPATFLEARCQDIIPILQGQRLGLRSQAGESKPVLVPGKLSGIPRIEAAKVEKVEGLAVDRERVFNAPDLAGTQIPVSDVVTWITNDTHLRKKARRQIHPTLIDEDSAGKIHQAQIVELLAPPI